MPVPETLLADAARAVSRAEKYIRSRASRHGGYCFYRSDYVDEPNLLDTYHAVATFALLDADIPHPDTLTAFLARPWLFGLHDLYHYAFTLDCLGKSSLIQRHLVERIRTLQLTPPSAAGAFATGSWLADALKAVRLKQRFTGELTYPEVVRFVEGLKANGGYGTGPDLLGTYWCMSILATLGEPARAADTRQFVDQRQVPSTGFALSEHSSMATLPIVYAGVRCCSMLELRIRYRAQALAWVLACQTGTGGFAQVPAALPNIKLTHQGLELITMLAPELPR